MSHVSEYKIKVKKLDMFAGVCRELGFAVREAVVGAALTVQQWQRNKVQAQLGIKIPGWGYEIAVTEDGRIMYDHYGSQPKTMEKLGQAIQEYNKQAILGEAWETTNSEEKLKNGAIKLVLEY